MQRRTRYYFNATNRDGIDELVTALCYGEQFAFDWLERNGYSNIEKVTKEKRAYTPASEATWEKNEPAIQEAINMLGITRPVTIKLTGRAGGRRGGYRPTPDCTGHHITIKNYLTPERASRTLWHELCHAMQFEREVGAEAGPVAAQLWRMSDARRGSYSSRPIEVEARSYEGWHEACPLTLPTQKETS